MADELSCRMPRGRRLVCGASVQGVGRAQAVQSRRGRYYITHFHRIPECGQLCVSNKGYSMKTTVSEVLDILSSKRRLVLVAIVAAATFFAGCTDYAGNFSVHGRVVDAQGAAMPHLRIIRASSERGDSLYASSHSYEKQTDEHGRFAFDYRGLGPKPDTSQIWHIAVFSPERLLAVKSINVPWCDTLHGYFMHDITIIVPEGE